MTKQTNTNRLGEVLRFALTGGVCFLIEFAALVLLRDTLLVNTLHVESTLSTQIAAPIAFLISVAVNYLLCLLWVFRGTKDAGTTAKAGFLLTSIIGLGLNSLCMALLGRLLGENQVLFTIAGFSLTMYMVNKVIATLLVMIWNYFTKRAVLKKKS